jgi:hypothetical protein
MRTDEFSTNGLSRRIAAIAGDVKEALRAERGEEYEERLIERIIRGLVARKLDAIEEDMREMFTSPARPEFGDLVHVLEEHAVRERAEDVVEAVELANEFDDDSVFTGRRAFSKARMAAMMEYLTSKGQHIYKTSLNKLLFYSDLTNFYLTGQGMSGAVYHNRPYGPVADPASVVLDELVNAGNVRVDERTRTLAAASAAETEVLTGADRKVLDWVAETYGAMTAGNISEFSHNEMAYKYTEPNEPIAYAYAQFFKRLPPKNLLDQ